MTAAAKKTTSTVTNMSDHTKGKNWKTSPPKPKVDVDLELMTAHKAADILGRNHPENRVVRKQHVASLVHDMSDREAWDFTGDTIKISKDGQLLDGQHRLEAIVETGRSVWMLVVRGIEESAYDTIDTGSRRLVSDGLRRMGYTLPHQVGRFLRLVITHETKMIRPEENLIGRTFKGKITPKDILGRVRHDPTVMQHFEHIQYDYNYMHKLFTYTNLAYLHYLLSKKNKSHANMFIYGLQNPSEEPKRSPILKVRKLIDDHPQYREKTQYCREMQMAMFVKAWNVWREKDGYKTLEYRDGDDALRPL